MTIFVLLFNYPLLQPPSMSLNAIHHEPGVHEDLHPHICEDKSPYTWSSEGYFPGGALGDLSKIFVGGPKVVKFDFSHSKLRKQPFLLKFSKSRGPRPPCRPFRHPCLYICNVCEFLGTNYCIPKRWPMGLLQKSLPPLAQTSSYATGCPPLRVSHLGFALFC